MKAAATGIGLAAAAWCVPVLAPRVPAVTRLMGVPCRLAGGPGEAGARTFDDGPPPEGTPAVLEALAAGGARATFFVVGEQVERNPGLVAETVAAGHVVAVHGYRHRLPLRLTPRAFADDLARAESAVAEASGRPPDWYRPPYGKFSWTALSAVRRSGLKPLFWSREGRDFSSRSSPDSIVSKATRRLGAGDVVLLHDSDTYASEGSHRRTAEALPRLLEEVERLGLRTVALQV